jgi:hypothetical protein
METPQAFSAAVEGDRQAERLPGQDWDTGRSDKLLSEARFVITA